MLLFTFSEKGGQEKKPMKILDAPIHLGALAENMKKGEENHGNIWMVKRLDDSSVSFYLPFLLVFNGLHSLQC